MDMRISSDEIRAYVVAQAEIKRRDLPDESRKVVLRLPTDSVDISPQARALAKGRLKVQTTEDGGFAPVTDYNSDPLLQLLDEGMSDVRKSLDEMKKLTELMEDESVSVEDRYAMQLKLVDLEGELDKQLYELNEEVNKLLPLPRAWLSTEGQTGLMDLLSTGMTVAFTSRYLTDRETGEIFEFESGSAAKYAEMVDKRTELKKETIKRVYMREHDPEAWAAHEEKLRKAYREEYEATAAMMDPYKDMPLSDLSEEERSVVVAPKTGETTFPVKPGSDIPGSIAVDLEQVANTPPPEDAGVILYRPMFDFDVFAEYQMEQYVEERLAELEKGDYEELNASRVSVMNAELAEESSDFLEDLTNQLTEHFQKFAAAIERANEFGGTEDPSQEVNNPWMKRAKEVAVLAMDFLKDTVLAGVQNDAVREEGEGIYNYKVEKSDDPMYGVRDIFAPVEITPREVWDYWQTLRSDLFQGGNAEA